MSNGLRKWQAHVTKILNTEARRTQRFSKTPSPCSLSPVFKNQPVGPQAFSLMETLLATGYNQTGLQYFTSELEIGIMEKIELPPTQKRIIQVAAVMIGASVALSIMNYGGVFGHASVEEKLKTMAKSLNARLPMQINAVTRWDRVEAGPGKTYAYIYTVSIDLTDSQKEEFKKSVTAKLPDVPEMRSILDAGVTVWYKYYDAAGKCVFEFPVSK